MNQRIILDCPGSSINILEKVKEKIIAVKSSAKYIRLQGVKVSEKEIVNSLFQGLPVSLKPHIYELLKEQKNLMYQFEPFVSQLMKKLFSLTSSITSTIKLLGNFTQGEKKVQTFYDEFFSLMDIAKLTVKGNEDLFYNSLNSELSKAIAVKEKDCKLKAVVKDLIKIEKEFAGSCMLEINVKISNKKNNRNK